jgi:hypothetical protein
MNNEGNSLKKKMNLKTEDTLNLDEISRAILVACGCKTKFNGFNVKFLIMVKRTIYSHETTLTIFQTR